MASKKPLPIDVKIVGTQQAATINGAFEAKLKADKAKKDYDSAREDAIPIIMGKVLGHWKKVSEVNTGSYNFTLPDGIVRQVTVQNRQSTKSYDDPKMAVDIIDKLNQNTKDDARLKASDVFEVVTSHHVNPIAMTMKPVRERILKMLTALEAEMKGEGALAPEVSLVLESKSLNLADHALGRLLALSDDFEASMNIIGNPVTINMVTKVQEDKK